MLHQRFGKFCFKFSSVYPPNASLASSAGTFHVVGF
jgi:hypothetical protein